MASHEVVRGVGRRKREVPSIDPDEEEDLNRNSTDPRLEEPSGTRRAKREDPSSFLDPESYSYQPDRSIDPHQEHLSISTPQLSRNTMDLRLMEAATKGDVSRLTQLEEEDPSLLLGLTPYGNTALHIAARFRHEEFTKEIYRRSTGLMHDNKLGETPLHVAAIVGDRSIVTFFITSLQAFRPLGSDVERGDVRHMLIRAKNWNGDTALHEALRNGHTDVALELLKAEPVLSQIVNKSNESALYMAASRGFDEVVEVVLQNASCQVGGPTGETALHAAALIGHVGIAKALLTAQPRTNRAGNRSGNTPLHYAAHKDNLSVVQLLLDSDASLVYSFNKDGDSPVHRAAAMGHIRIIRELIRRCSDAVDAINKKGKNALHVAIENRRMNVVKYIVEAHEFRGLLNQPDYFGNTPLHQAALKGDPVILRVLLGDGRLDRRAVNKSSETALSTFYQDKTPAATIQWNEALSLLTDAIPNSSPEVVRKVAEASLRKTLTEQIQSVTERYTNNTTLVATLMATVTFAAAFTVPGGYKSDEGPDQGLAILAKKAAFKAFLISNTIAMCTSLAVAFLCIFVAREDVEYLLHYKACTRILMWCAFAGLTVAFATGMYAVVAPDSLWIALFFCVLCCSLPFLTYILASWPFFILRFRLRKPLLDLLEKF